MALHRRARILSLGSYLPDQVLTNADLEKMVETNDEWIVSRTGIKERRIAGLNEFSSDMGVKAAKRALAKSKINKDDIDLILVATMSPDYLTPATASLIQAELKIKRAAAFDIQAACSGYLYGLSIAKAFIEAHIYKTILFVATEKMSSFIDYQDRSTCVLFGDGATAALITAEGEGLALNSISLGADGENYKLGIIPAGGTKHPASEETIRLRQHYFKMDGREIFKHAVRRMEQAARDCLQKAGIQESDLSWIVPHQANDRIIQALTKYFSLKPEQIVRTVHKYGNTSASSVGIALNELVDENPIKLGEKILLLAFGVGLTWAGVLLEKVEG